MATTYVLLMRGINVGGRKMPMAQLRTLMEGLGHTDVRTYVQSGNAVFTTGSDEGAEALARELEDAIEGEFGYRTACLVLAGDYLRAVADACPFPAAELEGKQLHATFLGRQPEPERFAGIDAEALLPEEYRVGERVLYLYTPDGLGRSKLAEAVHRPAVLKGIDWTSRNWNTVTKLLDMAGA
ncbi:DUF1697 domain-containing protein [Streptomyces sp. NPDC093225]|uniref:DUF1697 domain-containing protein n=1 Tax=Streptomyces sp. NPDC093225 TaxID=3366034 RepID=UPI0037F7A564